MKQSAIALLRQAAGERSLELKGMAIHGNERALDMMERARRGRSEETAEPVDKIDLERAQAAEQRAVERLRESQSMEERAAAEAELERARNRARLAMGRVGAGR